MSPKTVKNIKTLFHALTVVSLTLSQLSGVIPSKWAVYAAIITSAISMALNILTRNFPWLATEDESDDPK